MEGKGATLEELLPLITGKRGKQAFEEGDINAGIIHCGQSVGLIHDIPTVKEIIDSIISEAGLIGKRLQGMGLFTGMA